MSISPIRSPESAELSRRMARSPAGESGQVETSTILEELPRKELDAAAQIMSLQQSLQEKEHLVTALTDRLEQAAEQLDRVRRTGGDRALRRGTGAGLPAELLEDHRAAIDDLKQTLTRWEEMQAGMTLGRLETQVSELRDLIVGRGSTGDLQGATPDRSNSSRERPSSKSWWEQQKEALLGGESPSPKETMTGEYLPQSTALADLQIPEAPAPLNFENLVLDEARAALQERDAIITQLREQLLLAQAAETLAGHELGSVELPAGLRERLDLLEQQWQSKFRQVELDLSIERARLSREGAQVQSHRELIDKEMVRLGMNGRDVKADRIEIDGSPRRRWFSFLQGETSED